MSQQYEPEQLVVFRHNGSTIMGRIRLRSGETYAIETTGRELIQPVHASAISGVVGDQSCVLAPHHLEDGEVEVLHG